MSNIEYSYDELTKMKLAQEITIASNDAVENKRRLDELYATMMEQQRSQSKLSEFSLQVIKEQLRPHRLYNAMIYFDREEGQFVCRLDCDYDEIPLGDDDDDLDGGEVVQPILAYGDSPSDACDKFDELWLFGRKDK